MEKMGYQEGAGLGKEGQGIVAPVEASNQLGQHGLGFKVDGLERGKVFDQKIEEVVIQRVPEFIASYPGYDIVYTPPLSLSLSSCQSTYGIRLDDISGHLDDGKQKV